MTTLDTHSSPEANTFNEPRAGESRTVGGVERFVLAPLPLPVFPRSLTLGPQPYIVAQNDTVMDLGNSNHGVAFSIQVQLFINAVLLSISAGGFSFMAYVLSHRPDTTGGFWHHYYRLLVEPDPGHSLPASVILLVSLIIINAICFSVFVKSVRAGRREHPLRFHRQRREVCYFPTGSDTPVIVPWESVQAWVESGVMTTGSALMRSIDFCLAIPDPDAERVWLYRIPMGVMSQALLFWESIRRYMDESPESWAGVGGESESVSTFATSRRALLDDFAKQPKKRWFALSLADFSVSYLSVFLYYLFHIVTCWNLPFWVAQWYQKSVHGRPMPEQIEAWSAPLSPELWAQASEALRWQNAAIEAHYQRGGNLTDFLASQQAKGGC